MTKEINEKYGFDKYSRYETFRIIIEGLRKDRKLKILDVGGRGNAIRDFFPKDEVFYLETEDQHNDDDNLIIGDGTALQLKDNSYDWLVSADVLEHIPENKRMDFLTENLRVSKSGFILSTPKESVENISAEGEVNNFYQEVFSKDHPWLIEHRLNGLPKDSLFAEFIKNQKVKYYVLFNNALEIWKNFLKVYVLFDSSEYKDANLIKKLNSFYAEKLYKDDCLLTDNNSYRKIHIFIKDNNLEPDLSFFRKSPSEDIKGNVNRYTNEFLFEGLIALAKSKTRVETEFQNAINKFEKDITAIGDENKKYFDQLSKTESELSGLRSKKSIKLALKISNAISKLQKLPGNRK